MKEKVEVQSLVYFEINKLDKDSLFQKTQVDKELGLPFSSNKEFLSIFGYIMKHISESCLHAYLAGNILQFQNSIKLLNNILITEMLTPFMHFNSEISLYFTLITIIINRLDLHSKINHKFQIDS